ncbi:MAG: hypothetical protein AAB919_02200 [Patescibacteria group bacterium]
MPALSKRQKIVLNILGIGYTLFAIFALVNVYSLWKLTGASPLSYLLYALLYAALAALFFNRQRWLLAFFSINLLANAGLFIFRTYTGQGVLWIGVVIVALNALLVWYLYAIRRNLRDGTMGRLTAAAAFVLWAGTIYAVINNL